MNRVALIVVLIGSTVRAFCQGAATVALDNISNTSTDSAATANGLFWISTRGTPVLINQDFNAAFYGGTDSANHSTTTLDPTDDWSFWTVQEFAKPYLNLTNNAWGTVIARIRPNP